MTNLVTIPNIGPDPLAGKIATANNVMPEVKTILGRSRLNSHLRT
jgi:hypothetical protein